MEKSHHQAAIDINRAVEQFAKLADRSVGFVGGEAAHQMRSLMDAGRAATASKDGPPRLVAVGLGIHVVAIALLLLALITGLLLARTLHALWPDTFVSKAEPRVLVLWVLACGIAGTVRWVIGIRRQRLKRIEQRTPAQRALLDAARQLEAAMAFRYAMQAECLADLRRHMEATLGSSSRAREVLILRLSIDALDTLAFADLNAGDTSMASAHQRVLAALRSEQALAAG